MSHMSQRNQCQTDERRCQPIGKVTGPFGVSEVTSGKISFSAVCAIRKQCRLPKTSKQLGSQTTEVDSHGKQASCKQFDKQRQTEQRRLLAAF